MDVSEHLQGLERAISHAIYGPDEHSADLYARHLVRDLLRPELHLVDLGRELGNLVEGASEASKTHSGPQHLSIAQDEYPLIWQAVHPERLELSPNFHHRGLENHDYRNRYDHIIDQ